MKPEVGQHVKCFFRNSNILEGKVEEWGDTQIVLKSLDDQSLLIIHNPSEDIMLTKVILVEPAVVDNKERIRSKLQEVLTAPPEEELEAKDIAELKEMVNEQERLLIDQKKKEHFGTAGGAKLTQYSNMNVYNVPHYVTVGPHSPPSRKYQQRGTPRSAYVPGKLPPWVK